jgi:hypothetical protein
MLGVRGCFGSEGWLPIGEKLRLTLWACVILRSQFRSSQHSGIGHTVVARAPKYRGCGSGCESDGSGPMFHDFMCLPCCLLCWRGFARRLGCDVTCLRVCKAYVCVPMALLIILLPQFTRHIEALRKHFYHDAVVVFVCGGSREEVQYSYLYSALLHRCWIQFIKYHHSNHLPFWKLSVKWFIKQKNR